MTSSVEDLLFRWALWLIVALAAAEALWRSVLFLEASAAILVLHWLIEVR